jgi:hypothetical protein
MRRHRLPLLFLACVLMTGACRDASLPVGPETQELNGAPALARGATREHFEFDFPFSNEFFASCIGEVVHLEGSIHLKMDVTTTPGGVVITRMFDQMNPGFFIESESGVRYHVVHYQGHTQIIEGPVTVVPSTAALIVESDAGDRLNLGIHYQFVRNAAGNIVLDKFVGVCP